MLTPEQISAIRDQAADLTDPVNAFILQDIARRISEAGQLTSTASYQVWRAQQLGTSQREIKKQLRKLLQVSRRDLRRLLTQSAEVGYDFDIKRLPMVQAVPFRQNDALQRIVQAAVELAGADFDNITQTLGLLDPQGQALPLREAYTSAMDYAFKLVSTGATDYNTAIRRATKNLAEKGLLSIDYASGIHTSLEAAVRRSVMGGLGLMVEQTQQVTHDQLGCDGWEISAHANSAPDHEPIQGKQYADAEYQALNSHLARRIGTLNCGHIAFPVILGVSAPQYSPEELERLRAENEQGITYQGRHYTGYEAIQLQRRLERRIREQKRRVLVSEAAGDKEKLLTDQIKLQLYRQEYKRFSKTASLRTENERAYVVGFGQRQAKEAVSTYKRVEKVADSMYDIGSTRQNVSAWLRDKPLRSKILSGVDFPSQIHPGRQRKHIPGSSEYMQYVLKFHQKGQFGPARLTISEADAQVLVDKYRGTGILPRDKSGRWLQYELITVHPDAVGIVVNNMTGAEAETTTFKIHYSKHGTHIVPDYPSKKGAKARR